MTIWANNLNGIASGTTVTTSNSGGVSGTAFTLAVVPSGGSLTAQSTSAFEGATGLQIVYPTTSASGYVHWTLSGAAVGTRVAESFWYRVAALPSTLARVATLGAVDLSMTTTGQIAVGTPGAPFATSTAVAAGTWMFIQFATTTNASATGGRVECKVTTAAGATALNYDSGATVNGGTASIIATYFGRSAAAVAGLTASYDLINVDNTLASGFPGSVAPVVTNTGGMKVWTGTAWAIKPVKVWTGTAWVTKPVKRWTGTAWVTTP